MAYRSSRRRSRRGGPFWLLLLVAAGFFLWNNRERLGLPDFNLPTQTEAKPDAKPQDPQAEPGAEAENPVVVAEETKVVGANYEFESAVGFGLPAYRKTDQIVRHEGYTLCYDERYEQARWVAYQLLATETQGSSQRQNDFRPDPLVKTGSATPDDYRGSGYDRGHLAPAADFKSSPKLMSESFYMSNMSPQVGAFNRGVWENLEEQVRRWARKGQVIYVVTGPILQPGLPTIGRKNKVAVPSTYYKVILDLKKPQPQAIGFLMRNEGSERPVKEFAVTVDEVERVTGLDFFPQLPDGMEKRIEGNVKIDWWF